MKKPTVLFLIICFGIGILSYYYFSEGNEPEAFYSVTTNTKLEMIRNDLAELKADLKKKGKYNCCIKNDCSWCAIYMGHCPCEDLVSRKGSEKSCPECAAAWNKKQGKIPGIDPDAIQVTTFGVFGLEKEGHHHPD